MTNTEFQYMNKNLPVHVRVADLLQRMTLEEKVNEMNLVADMVGKTLANDMDVEDVLQMMRNFGVDLTAEELETNSSEIPGGSIWTEEGQLDIDKVRYAYVEVGRAHIYGMAASLPPAEMAEAINIIQEVVEKESRLGIPPLFASEGLHGHFAVGATMFPQAIGMGSTWDTALIEKIGAAIAAEARSVGTANLWFPVLDLARDPRWGRTEETYGEDPYLVTQLGVAMVKGMQGDDVSAPDKVVSTLKHFGGHGGALGGRDSNMVGMSERDLREIHFAPFEAAVKEAGALSIMPALHAIDSVPCHANSWLLRTIMLHEWGFEGHTVSDANGVEDLIGKHHISANQKDAIKEVVEAGLDIHNSGSNFIEPLVELVQEGIIDVSLIDEAVSRVLSVKFRLGLFDNRYVDPEVAKNIVGCEAHHNLARLAAQKSIVLLKNENNALPLSKELQSVLVVGHHADNPVDMLGGYTYPNGAVTVVEGVRAKLGDQAEVSHVKGGSVWEATDEEIAEAVEAAKEADFVIMVAGDSSTCGRNASSGEGVDRALLDLPGRQQELIEKVYAVGKPVVLVLINGRPASIRWANENIPAIVEAWYPGCEGGHAIADVLFGDYNPGGKLPVTFPKHSGQLPLFYNQTPSGRHIRYRDESADPLYPFGYGLSYTSFEYSDLEITPKKINPAGEVVVSLNVTNIGKISGDEVVQLYINDEVSSVVTPMITLKGFQRVYLQAGESKQVSFTLGPRHLEILDINLKKVVEPGVFKVLVGSSSEDIRLEGSFEVLS